MERFRDLKETRKLEERNFTTNYYKGFVENPEMLVELAEQAGWELVRQESRLVYVFKATHPDPYLGVTTATIKIKDNGNEDVFAVSIKDNEGDDGYVIHGAKALLKKLAKEVGRTPDFTPTNPNLKKLTSEDLQELFKRFIDVLDKKLKARDKRFIKWYGKNNDRVVSKPVIELFVEELEKVGGALGDIVHIHGIGNNHDCEIIALNEEGEEVVVGYFTYIRGIYGDNEAWISDVNWNAITKHASIDTTFASV